MYTVEKLFKHYGKQLGLELLAGKAGVKRRIRLPEVQRPGLSLAGYLKNHVHKRILIFGRVEIEYLKDLSHEERINRLKPLLKTQTPAIIIARGYRPLKELSTLCDELALPLFRTSTSTMSIIGKLTLVLNDEFSPTMTCHGTLVEVFGVGVLIQGDSSVGKSETALGLIERGHRLISDDIVHVKKKEDRSLEGFGAELTKHHMEIRGIGIINVANLYGIVCVREYKNIEIVVRLEEWDDGHFYDRVGIEEKFCEILGVKLPFHLLPLKPGRDVVLLLETVALNHRLKVMGYNSAKEFHTKLTETISSKGSLNRFNSYNRIVQSQKT
ncbi:MAG: HPr(Ser) kinase/phosphatase [Parachlamydiaceae bacterium]